MLWSYGVTTVPERFDILLPKTIESLKSAGFDNPRLFIDGCVDPKQYLESFPSLEITVRREQIRSYGNWVLALWELYIRSARADRYAIFQDDLVACKNLKSYLESCTYPECGYLNLYTHPQNQELANRSGFTGWFESNQRGRGAVGLVFNRPAVVALLGQQVFIAKPQHPIKGHKSIDGVVLTSMRNAGFKEYTHNPSLIEHTGEVSSMGNRQHPTSESFPGEEYDLITKLSHLL